MEQAGCVFEVSWCVGGRRLTDRTEQQRGASGEGG
jgi:hypothetical protein